MDRRMDRLDLHVSRAIFTANLMERALFDPTPWTMVWGSFTVPADKEITDEAVTFRGDFPMAPDRPLESAELWCGEDLLSVKRIDVEHMDPMDPVTLEWCFQARVIESV